MNKKEILDSKIKILKKVLKDKKNALQILEEEQKKHPELLDKNYPEVKNKK